MYKSYTATEYKKYIGLPSDYKVDGMLIYGTWNKNKQLQILKQILPKIYTNTELNSLPSFLESVLEIKIKDKTLWFVVSYGGVLLSEFLHLACLFGSKKNILLGSCGGLHADLKTGDLIIPTFSYGNESTTRMYQPEVLNYEFYSDKDLSKKIAFKLPPELKFYENKTTTCQAMMAETWEDVQRWSRQGYYGVEMEAATVFAVSNNFQVSSAGLLMVADNLIQNETVFSENYQNFGLKKNEIIKIQYKIALQELMIDN